MISATELARTIDQSAKDLRFSGTISVSQGREVLFEHAYGLASRQLNVPNALDTKFHIASLTKMFVAMATLTLVEQGRVDLRARPGAYRPELATLDPDITLHHLLSHTSGLQDVYDVPNLRFEVHKLKIEQGDLLSYLVGLPRLFPPGEGWSYSTTGYLLVGFLLETVTGLPFAELMQRLVLAPLSMTDTGLDVPRRINVRRAYGHTMESGELVNADNDRLSGFDGPGELYSTVRDLKKWCDAMFDCPLVSPQTLALMFTPYERVGPVFQYGYGWFLASRFRMHGGGTPGFISRIRQYPDQNLSIIVLANSDHASPDAIVDAIEPLIVE